MAQLTLTFNTSAAQDAKLAKALARVNAERAAFGGTENPAPLDPYPTVEAWLKAVTIEAVKSYIQHQDRVDQETLKSRIENATPTQLAQIEAILAG